MARWRGDQEGQEELVVLVDVPADQPREDRRRGRGSRSGTARRCPGASREWPPADRRSGRAPWKFYSSSRPIALTAARSISSRCTERVRPCAAASSRHRGPAPRRRCRRRGSARACPRSRACSVGSSTGASSSTRVSRLRGMRSAEPMQVAPLVAALEAVDARVLEEAPDDRHHPDVVATRPRRPAAGSRSRARSDPPSRPGRDAS